MIFKAHQYQIDAAGFIFKNPGSGLLADPGTGKTAISLMVINELKRLGLLNPPALILSTLRIAEMVWPDEIQKWDQFQNLTFEVLHGTKKDAAASRFADIHLCNNEGLQRLMSSGRIGNYRTLFLDEASKYGNPDAIRTKILMKAAPRMSRRHILTGTPTPSSLLNIYSQAYIADLGKSLGGTFEQFRGTFFFEANGLLRRWVDETRRAAGRPLYDAELTEWAAAAFPGIRERHLKFLLSYHRQKYFSKQTVIRYYSDWQTRPGAAEQIIKLVSPIMYRLDASKLLTLPNLVDVEIPVEIPSKYAKLSGSAIAEFIRNPEGTYSRYMIAREAGGGIAESGVMHTAKIDALRDLIDELQGAPLLVGFSFAPEGRALSKIFDAPLVEGGTKNAVDIFRAWNRGEVPILFMQYKAGSHGLNLQKSGGHICHFNLTNDPDDYTQFISRVWRQGAIVDKMFNYRLMCRNCSTDRDVYAIVKENLDRQTAFLAGVGRSQ